MLETKQKLIKCGFDSVDIYGDGTALTAFNAELDLFDDILLVKKNELLFCSENFSVQHMIPALLLVNELNSLTDYGRWAVRGEGKERHIGYFCYIGSQHCEHWKSLFDSFIENYMRLQRALRMFREECIMSGRELTYCATLQSAEEEIPAEELLRIERIQTSFESGILDEDDLSVEDVLLLEKLFQRQCMQIHRKSEELKCRIYRSLRNATKNKRKLDIL